MVFFGEYLLAEFRVYINVSNHSYLRTEYECPSIKINPLRSLVIMIII